MDTLTRMRAFVAVAEAGGYSAASRRIGRSKAILSKYVRELEDELGALLLNRTSRRVSLTAAGELYLQRGAELIREVDTLGDLVRDQSRAAGGTVRLSAPRAFADAEMGRVLTDFALAHPEIVLDVELSDRFVDLVEEGFDLTLRISTPEDSDLITRRLAPVRLLTVGAPQLIERVGRPRTPRDMESLPVIMDTNTRPARHLRYRGMDGEAVTVVPGNVRLSSGSPAMTLRAAEQGIGFAVVPDFVAGPSVEAGRTVELLKANRWEGGALQILYPHRRHQPQRVRLLIDFLAMRFRVG